MEKNKFKRIFVIVMDSVGCGKAKDAAKFGDEGANTLAHIDAKVGGFKLPTLARLGLGNLDHYQNVKPGLPDHCYVTRLNEKSNGKDTMTGHWEMMGLHITKPFKTFTDTGFPKELLDEITKQTGYKIIGNCAASGTEIIKELGEEQLKSHALIVYTSADSVLQIAANESIIPVPELYRICDIVRKITLKDEWKVGRIIARPFVGTASDNFTRTPKRHDYALSPTGKTYMDYLKAAGLDVIAVGKINDIFNTQGVTQAYKTVNNDDGMNRTIEIAKQDFRGLCFVNLVDFDMDYGHRRNPEGYGQCLEAFDAKLNDFLKVMRSDDLLMITADHGNDPTWHGSDHTREQVPLLVYSPGFAVSGSLHDQDSFAIIGATVAANFGIKAEGLLGTSILNQLL